MCLAGSSVPHHAARSRPLQNFLLYQDRLTYLRLLAKSPRRDVSLLGFCLMTNHVHLVAIPAQPDSLRAAPAAPWPLRPILQHAVGAHGHLWQNRFFACVLGQDHLWSALAYVERNPLRARMVDRRPNIGGRAQASTSATGRIRVVDLAWWQQAGRAAEWAQTLSEDDVETGTALRRALTRAGRLAMPVSGEKSLRFNRSWVRGRPGRRAMREPAKPPPADR